MPKHTISIFCFFEVAVVALFCITKRRKKLDAICRPNWRKQNWKGLIGLSLGDLWLICPNFETSTWFKFHNKPCAGLKVNWWILLHISWLFKQNLRFPCINITQSNSDKTAAKKRWPLFIIVLIWTSKQPFTIHFFLASCNVFPVALPEIFSKTQGSDYWQLIHRFA